MPSPTRSPLDRPPLTRTDLLDDPLAQFRAWLDEAREEADLELPEAACLSTTTLAGDPDGRMILVRGVDDRGVIFYTNLRSRKGEALAEVPKAALTLYWEPLRRQVRIRGRVEPVGDTQSDAYFAGRPRGSKLGAWASEQSEPVESREALDARFAETEKEFASAETIPRPPHWGGYRVVPAEVEFWQEGRDRLHDRFLYTCKNQLWNVLRIQP